MTYQIKGLKRREIAPLTDGAFEAISASRAKWQFLAWHPNEEKNMPACACCAYRALHDVSRGCRPCPVDAITEAGCPPTPWMSWLRARAFNGGCTEAEDEYHFIEGIYSIEMHRRMGYTVEGVNDK